DDAARDGVVEAERVADGDDRVADLHAGGVGQRERLDLRGRRVDVDDGDVGADVGTDDGRLVGGAVVELHRDGARAVDDVVVGDDVALVVVEEAGALRLRGTAAAAEGGRAGGLGRVDLDDARRILLRDVGDREGAVRDIGGRAAGGDGRR